MTARNTRGSGLAPLLLVICCLLGAAVWAQWRDPDLLVQKLVAADTLEQPAVVEPGGPNPKIVPAAAIPRESAFAVIAQRPLFMQSRRPPEIPVEPILQNQEDSSLPNFVLTGIVVSGTESMAILEPVRNVRRTRKKNAPPVEPALIVHIGDTVGGWTIESVEKDPSRVVLARGGDRRVMELVPDEVRRRSGLRPNAHRKDKRPRQPVQPAALAPTGQTGANK